MPLTSLTLTDFRNLASAEITPLARGLNILCGQNGSGKTSMLEAIHYLAYGKSFRTSTATKLINCNSDKFSLFGHLVSTNETIIPVGMERAQTGVTRIRVSGADSSGTSELAKYLPIRVINSQSHQLFEAGPLFRRQFLDWGLFYQEPSFWHLWRQCERALKQRNMALKAQLPKQEVEGWSAELARCGEDLSRLRIAYVDQLLPYLLNAVKALLPVDTLEMSYSRGWDSGIDYAAALEAAYFTDRRYGYTQVGPHRADLDITIDGLSVRHFLSRGQQKLLVCAMMLAQGKLLAEAVNADPVYLIDDLPAELDSRSGSKLISLLSQQSSQVFVTAIDYNVMAALIDDNIRMPVKVFHVEHGQVSERQEEQGRDKIDIIQG